MNPLKRKMFMQQGGMVPQQMMPPPPQQQMMAPPQQMMPPPQQMMPPAEMPMAPGPEEVMAEAQRQEGDELVSGILSQVDSAQDYEQLMNAIRGDEVPVEGRRGELAGLVGEPDAEQTPDSVLTLVQPTMAIVEAQGGLDALMQGEADIAMEDEGGMPTDMAGGVGSMLMAGQPEEPVQMADGGMVRKMQEGSAYGSFRPDAFKIEPMTDLNARSLQDIYAGLLPTFQTGIGQPDKDVARAQALASIGGAGLRLAQGSRQPGANFLSDLAGAFAPVPGEITAIAGQASEADRAARMGALQTASGIYQEEQKDIRKQKAAERTATLGNMFEIGLTGFRADIAKKVQESAQDHQARLANDVNALQKYIAELNSSTELNKTQMLNDARQKLQVLIGEQKQAEIAVGHENLLKTMDVTQGYTEKNMNLDFNNKSALLSQKTLAEKLLQAERLEQQQQQFAASIGLDREQLEQANEQFFAKLGLDKNQLEQARILAREKMALEKELTELGIDGQITLQGLKDKTSKELLDLSQALEYDKLKLEAAELRLEYGDFNLTTETGNKVINDAGFRSWYEKLAPTESERRRALLSNSDIRKSYASGTEMFSSDLFNQALLDSIVPRTEIINGNPIKIEPNLSFANAKAVLDRIDAGQNVNPVLETAAKSAVGTKRLSEGPEIDIGNVADSESPQAPALISLANSIDASGIPENFVKDIGAGINVLSRIIGGPTRAMPDAAPLNQALNAFEATYVSLIPKASALLAERSQGGGATIWEKFKDYLPEKISGANTIGKAGSEIKNTTIPYLKQLEESLTQKAREETEPNKLAEINTNISIAQTLIEAYTITADEFLYKNREQRIRSLEDRTGKPVSGNIYENILRNNTD